MDEIYEQARAAALELCEQSGIGEGDVAVIGCSTSVVLGKKMGTSGCVDTAKSIYDGLMSVFAEKGIYLAAQCCEHLNRAIVVERECMEKYDFEQVSVKPALHAGGAWSVQAMQQFTDPVVVEDIKMRARAGIDIGGVFIGMHMRPVCVPIHNENTKIGCANVTMARNRPKLIGGERAQY